MTDAELFMVKAKTLSKTQGTQPIDEHLLERAIIFAARKHKGQKRKGNDAPYILHPMRVMAHLYYAKLGTKNLILLMACCVLHDVVEDCDVSLQEIAKLFGYKVASIVDELTTDKEKCKAMGKTKYLSEKMFRMSSYALCIKLADRLDNVGDSPAAKTLAETASILDYLENEGGGRKLTATHEFLIHSIRAKLK